MGKGDSRLHARTQADADTMAAKWEQTFGKAYDANGVDTSSLFTLGERHVLDPPPDWVSDNEPDEVRLIVTDVDRSASTITLSSEQRDAMWDHIQRGRDR